MNFDDYYRDLRRRLVFTFTDVLRYFQSGVAEKYLHYRPVGGGWTAAEILEHITITSHYLLILIRKGADKARRKSAGQSMITVRRQGHYHPDRLNAIEQHKSFAWDRPEHMEPTGKVPLSDVETKMFAQLVACLQYLDELGDGAGLLHETTMTVDGLGRLNVYEYVDFLGRHVARHITQIEANRKSYLASIA